MQVVFDTMRVRDYWETTLRHRRAIGIAVAVATLGTTIWMLRTPDYYLATSRLEIAMERPGWVGDAGPTARQSMVSADPAYFNTQLQLITSPALLRRVIVALELERDPSFNRYMSSGGRLIRRVLRLGYLGTRDDLRSGAIQPADAEAFEAQRMEPYVAELQRRVVVKPVLETRTAFRETRMIDVTVDHPVPALAAAISNGVAEAFVSENRDKTSRSGASTNAYLSARIDTLQDEVREAEERLIAYARGNQILSLEPGQNVSVDRLVNLNRQLLEAENERKLAEANLQEAGETGAASALAADAAGSVIGDSDLKLADLRAHRAQLLVGATEEWPEVREVTEQIAVLEANIERVKRRAVDVALAGLKMKYRQASAHEASVRAEFERQRGVIDVQNQAAVSYRLIQQEVTTKRGLLEAALQRLGENDLAQAAVSNNASVVDYALLPNPEEPDGPWRLPIMAAAFFFSLVGAAGLSLARESFNQTLRSRIDVEASLDVPAVGLIRAAPASPSQIYGPQGTRPEWDEFAEDYRRLRTAMLLPSNGAERRTWLVTSSHPAEGKSTTAINLAASLVQTGARVLLVDADVRRPRLHAILSLDNSSGLSTLLCQSGPFPFERGTNDPVANSDGTITLHGPSGVHVMPCGPESLGAMELVGSDRMSALLTSLRRSFDAIVIDSPPIAVYIDGLVIAPKVDAVLLVVKASTTPLDVVRYSTQLLQRVGAHVAGVVLNRIVPVGRKPYGYPVELRKSADQETFNVLSQDS